MSQPLDGYVEALLVASRCLDRDAQAKLAQEFFRQVSSLSLDLDQSCEAWEKILERRDHAARAGEPAPPLRQLVLDYFLRSTLLTEPVITEYAEIQRLRAGAALDPLTGLQNRRFFDDRLKQEIDAAVRYAQEFSLLLIDLNRFKEVNDVHGHSTGDKVLALSGKLLGELARASDQTYRIGGDEFALELPRTAYDGAVAAATRVRERFTEAIQPLELSVPVSIAYGVATAPREARTAEGLFSLADERLYNFKRSIGSPRCAPRASPRIPLGHTNAFALLRWDSDSCRASVVDFSIGGVGLVLKTPVAVPHEFLGQLHLPRLHALSTRLHKAYEAIDPDNVQRIGCAFVEPDNPGSGDSTS